MPCGPIGPLPPIGPCCPGEPLSPDAPGGPLSPVVPRSPDAPAVPLELKFEVIFEEGLDFTLLVEGSFFSFWIEGIVEDSDDFRNLTSKTEYNEENKSFTTTQITSTSLMELGRGFLESPTTSEKIPSLTLR